MITDSAELKKAFDEGKPVRCRQKGGMTWCQLVNFIIDHDLFEYWIGDDYPRYCASMSDRIVAPLLQTEMILPLYGARIQLIVTADILHERKKQEHLFGPIEGTCYDALCSRSTGHNFALFFEPNALCHRIIGHEIFHLTHRVMEWCDVPFSGNNHEAFSAVHGEICQWVYDELVNPLVPDRMMNRREYD